jgi:hypothetical protein
MKRDNRDRMKSIFSQVEGMFMGGIGSMWVSAALVGLMSASGAFAAARYWDIDGPTAGPGGVSPSGIWSETADQNWNQNLNGNSGFNTFGADNDAVFSAGATATGAYTVTISGTFGQIPNVSSITIEEGTPTFTGGTINFSDATPDLIINSGRTLNWGSTAITATGNGAVNLSGGGILNFTQDLSFSGTLNFGGGTLRLTDADLTLGTLNVTANSVIEFAGSASSLNLTNLSVSPGVTLTINQWVANTDYFYTQNWAGAAQDVSGSPMNRVVFASWTGADTRWYSADEQIAPIPEPARAGFWMIGGLAVLGGVARRRRR